MENKKPRLTIRRSTRFTQQEEKDIMQYATDNEITYSAALRKLALESLYK